MMHGEELENWLASYRQRIDERKALNAISGKEILECVDKLSPHSRVFFSHLHNGMMRFIDTKLCGRPVEEVIGRKLWVARLPHLQPGLSRPIMDALEEDARQFEVLLLKGYTVDLLIQELKKEVEELPLKKLHNVLLNFYDLICVLACGSVTPSDVPKVFGRCAGTAVASGDDKAFFLEVTLDLWRYRTGNKDPRINPKSRLWEKAAERGQVGHC